MLSMLNVLHSTSSSLARHSSRHTHHRYRSKGSSALTMSSVSVPGGSKRTEEDNAALRKWLYEAVKQK